MNKTKLRSHCLNFVDTCASGCSYFYVLCSNYRFFHNDNTVGRRGQRQRPATSPIPQAHCVKTFTIRLNFSAESYQNLISIQKWNCIAINHGGTVGALTTANSPISLTHDRNRHVRNQLSRALTKGIHSNLSLIEWFVSVVDRGVVVHTRRGRSRRDDWLTVSRASRPSHL